MHAIKMIPEVQARTIANRGGPFAFEQIDPRRTCHVVIDLQNGFMEQGALLEVPVAREIVPHVNAISHALRAAGGLVAYTRWTYVADEPPSWSKWYGRGMSDQTSLGLRQAFPPGSHDHALWPGLDVLPEDVVVDKTRFSAFVPGTCALRHHLERHNVDTVIITGTLTNSCCESTARDACQLNYQTIFVADGTATVTDAEHNGTLNNLSPVYADIMTTEKVLAVILSNR